MSERRKERQAPRFSERDMDKLAGIIRKLLVQLGENPGRPGLQRTPQRVARAWQELTAGYCSDTEQLFKGALFDAPDSEMVIVSNIQFYSLCEHHLLPFFGKCHVAYIPNGKVVGLSKIPRLVDALARRLQVQEILTSHIANVLERILAPKGLGVVMEARHLCMEMRGAKSQCAPTKTSAMRGIFRSDARTRKEFLDLIER